MSKNYIQSALDLDLYLYSVSYAFVYKYPNASGQLVFADRNKTVYSEDFLEKFKDEVKRLEKLTMTNEEMEWCIKKIPYIPRPYWEMIRGFHYDASKITIGLSKEGYLEMSVTDYLYKAVLYEVPLLALLSEMTNEYKGYEINMGEVKKRLDRKMELGNDNELKTSEFGTRRRFSYEVQEYVVKSMKERYHYFSGTSNVYLAKKYGLTPIGTQNHFWFMFHAAQFGYRHANLLAMEAWRDVYRGSLGIALTDTLTSDVFFENFSEEMAHLYDGVRQDSGIEEEFVDKCVGRYRDLGINPRTKVICFSNSLNFPKMVTIRQYCEKRGINAVFGVGNNLVADTGFPPANQVMKLMRCKMSDKQDKYRECIKISDDLGKHMGDPEELKRAAHELGITL